MQKEKTMEDLISRQAAIAKDTNVPSTDLISRQAAIDARCKACYGEGDYHKCDGYPETNTWCDELVALRALPSAQPDPSAYSDKLWRAAYERGKAEAQRWIPCSERLPEKEAYYLITYGGAVTWQHWLHNRWYGIGDPERVTAWMPLPKPYRAERREDG